MYSNRFLGLIRSKGRLCTVPIISRSDLRTALLTSRRSLIAQQQQPQQQNVQRQSSQQSTVDSSIQSVSVPSALGESTKASISLMRPATWFDGPSWRRSARRALKDSSSTLNTSTKSTTTFVKPIISQPPPPQPPPSQPSPLQSSSSLNSALPLPTSESAIPLTPLTQSATPPQPSSLMSSVLSNVKAPRQLIRSTPNFFDNFGYSVVGKSEKFRSFHDKMNPFGDRIVTTGACFHLVSLCMSDILYLRLFGAMSSLCSITFNLTREPPFYLSVCWGLLFVSINGLMIMRLLFDRRDVQFSGEELKVYETYFLQNGMSPRQFVKLNEMCIKKVCQPGEVVIGPGEKLDAVVLVLDGEFNIERYGADGDQKGFTSLPGGMNGSILGARRLLSLYASKEKERKVVKKTTADDDNGQDGNTVVDELSQQSSTDDSVINVNSTKNSTTNDDNEMDVFPEAVVFSTMAITTKADSDDTTSKHVDVTHGNELLASTASSTSTTTASNISAKKNEEDKNNGAVNSSVLLEPTNAVVTVTDSNKILNKQEANTVKTNKSDVNIVDNNQSTLQTSSTTPDNKHKNKTQNSNDKTATATTTTTSPLTATATSPLTTTTGEVINNVDAVKSAKSFSSNNVKAETSTVDLMGPTNLRTVLPDEFHSKAIIANDNEQLQDAKENDEDELVEHPEDPKQLVCVSELPTISLASSSLTTSDPSGTDEMSLPSVFLSTDPLDNPQASSLSKSKSTMEKINKNVPLMKTNENTAVLETIANNDSTPSINKNDLMATTTPNEKLILNKFASALVASLDSAIARSTGRESSQAVLNYSNLDIHSPSSWAHSLAKYSEEQLSSDEELGESYSDFHTQHNQASTSASMDGMNDSVDNNKEKNVLKKAFDLFNTWKTIFDFNGLKNETDESGQFSSSDNNDNNNNNNNNKSNNFKGPYTKVVAEEESRVWVIPFDELVNWMSKDVLVALSVTRALASALVSRTEMAKEENAVRMYFELLRLTVADGRVSAKQKAELSKFRSTNQISDSTHFDFLQTLQWSPAEFEKGHLSTKSSFANYVPQWLQHRFQKP